MTMRNVTPIDPFGAVVQSPEPGASLGELPVAELRELVRVEHLVLLRGFAAFGTAEELSRYCEGWGELGQWPFGTVLELVEQQEPEDHIFDNSYMPMHWDGMYREQVPEFQVFQCVRAPGSRDGGETTFSHTARALATADPAELALWSQVTGSYRRKMEYYDSLAVSPLVTAHPTHGTPVIRYNEPVDLGRGEFVNHPDLEFSGPELDRVHQSLRKALYAPENLYAHAWQTGDVVITDNYTLLHGRNAFTARAPRHLRRVHVLGDPPLDNPALVTTA
ncbi:TauD/TfdA family dioxygenase [Pseudonocardiaceae bacterium YIM PH 21723]|nr:TauD/TfdA family dioxygenase [Pseudonocardiaceae bacterium YIM PH 21723]